MSSIWKLVLESVEPSGFLFTKKSPTEASCNACSKSVSMPNCGPANVKHHLAGHPKYQKQLETMKEVKKAIKKVNHYFVLFVHES
jgi:hypothetical protein